MRSSRPASLSAVAVLLCVLLVYAVHGLSANAATVEAQVMTSCGKGTNLVGNARFHAGSGGDFTAANNPNGIPKWTVGPGSVDVVGPGVRPGGWQQVGAGNFSVDLNGLAPGSIDQTITDTAGVHYRLCFYFSGNPDGRPIGAPALKKMQVTWGATPAVTFAVNVNHPCHHTDAHMCWVRKSLGVVGTGSDVLKFSSFATTGAYGAVIGHVTVEP